jgi:hypothetical protein
MDLDVSGINSGLQSPSSGNRDVLLKVAPFAPADILDAAIRKPASPSHQVSLTPLTFSRYFFRLINLIPWPKVTAAAVPLHDIESQRPPLYPPSQHFQAPQKQNTAVLIVSLKSA